MRIGWISPFDINQRRGGWQGSNYHLFQALSRAHDAIEVIAPVPPPADPWDKWLSRALTLFTGKRLVHSHSDRAMKRLSDLISARTQNLNVDVYLFFGNAGYFMHFPPKPFTYFTDSAFVPFLRFQAKDRNYMESEYRRLRARESGWFSKIDRIFTTSEYSRRDILETYGDVITPEKVCNVHIGPNFDYGPIPKREASKPVVLFICSNFINKGGDLAIQAVGRVRNQIPNLEIHIVGAEPPADFQRDFVHVHGWVDRGTAQGKEKWEQIMRHSSLLLSLPKYDLTPGSILEAAAYGIPTMSLSVGGIPEMIQEGQSGWLLPENASNQDVARALVMALSNLDEMNRMGMNARKNYETTWNWDSVASRILDELFTRL